jgi:hypothetical protein
VPNSVCAGTIAPQLKKAKIFLKHTNISGKTEEGNERKTGDAICFQI